jgi:hypothetical protein
MLPLSHPADGESIAATSTQRRQVILDPPRLGGLFHGAHAGQHHRLQFRPHDV